MCAVVLDTSDGVDEVVVDKSDDGFIEVGAVVLDTSVDVIW